MSDTQEPTVETATYEELVYAHARMALGDPESSARTLQALMTLLVLDGTRQKSMTANEYLRIDVMRREAQERLPEELKLAMKRWAAQLVGEDPESVTTR